MSAPPAIRRGLLRPPPLVAAIAFVKLGLMLWCASAYGYSRDELYYLACARRLAWGYVGLPPLSIAGLALVQRIYGETLLSIRLVPALAGALVVILTARLAARFGASTAGQALAALAVLVAPQLLANDHIYSLVSLDVVLCTVTAGLVARAVTARPEDGSTLEWIRVGVMVGIGLLNRYTMGAYVLALYIGLALTAQRRWLRLRGPWLGLGFAMLLLSPYLAWERTHQWPTLELWKNAMAERLAGASVAGFAQAQLSMMLPANVVVWGAGLYGLFRSPRLAPYRLFGVAYVVLFLGLMLGGGGVAELLVPIYPVLFAAGASVLDEARSRPNVRPWALPAFATLLAVTGLVTVPLALPLFRVAQYESYARALHVAARPDVRGDDAPLPEPFAAMYGWPELVRAVGFVAADLSNSERREAVVLASNVGEAGALEMFGSLVGLPAVISGHDEYWLWGTAGGSGRVVIAVGGDEAELRSRFRTVDLATVFGHSLAVASERHVKIFVCRDSVEPLDTMWASFKVYD